MITLPTDRLRLEPAPRLTEFLSHGNILNATDSFDWLLQNDFVGWTYSMNAKLWTLLQPTKIIVDRADSLREANGKIYNSRIRQASCCHAKCYIGDDAMLIGSFNLTAPTIEDLCVLVKDKKSIAHMRKVFNQHWKALA